MNHSRNLAEEKESPEGFLLKLFYFYMISDNNKDKNTAI
jgi:hypothetical protein